MFEQYVDRVGTTAALLQRSSVDARGRGLDAARGGVVSETLHERFSRLFWAWKFEVGTIIAIDVDNATV